MVLFCWRSSFLSRFTFLHHQAFVVMGWTEIAAARAFKTSDRELETILGIEDQEQTVLRSGGRAIRVAG